ncbi:MAG TPA: ATP phosphoribosyltransferase [Thermohalobaculum sp.]|nr:ATP phosphoribosyltransferase [Thermohalobaculum sp.]
MTLTLGLPSKGRLQSDTIDWFAARGIEIARTGDQRQYAAEARGIDGLSVVMLSANEIPRELAQGRIHLGVTGEDLIRERIPGWRDRIALTAKMGFGQADLIVAVPAFWVDVECMADLDEVAEAFRARHGHGLRIATKYHNLTRAFFQAKGVADYRLIDSQGATEAGPKNQTCEAIVDITSSGETLRANQLKLISDGLILQSEANLCLSRVADWGAAEKAVLASLSEALGVPLAV